MSTKKRAPRSNTYSVALKHAEREYAKKLKERDAANSALSRLNGEIPNLEAMIRVLKNQLHPSPVPAVIISAAEARTMQKRGEPLPAGLYELGEVPEGAGSILIAPDGSTPQQAAPDIDSIPGMEGSWT